MPQPEGGEVRLSDIALQQVNRIDGALNDTVAEVLAGRGWQPTFRPYIGYGGTGWVRVMCRVLMGREDGPKRPASLGRGWRNFVSVPLEGVKVRVRAGSHEETVVTDSGGLIDHKMPCDLPPGWHEAVLMADGAEPARAQVRVIADKPQVALLSDVDDTVLVTSLPRPMIAAWNTFVLNEHARRPVPGMAVLYDRIVRHYDDAPVFYLSTGAWNVCPVLRRFLSRNMYPMGPLLLTQWGPTEDHWFRSGTAHKRNSLIRLAEELPQLSWIMVGDDGQHDQQTYANFARAFPDRVKAVAIRTLSTAERVLASGTPRDRHDWMPPAGVPWVSAPNGARLADKLQAANVLSA